MTKSMPLTKGYSTLVDDEDHECLSRWSWSALTLPDGSVYAYRTAPVAERKAGSPKAVYMHRQLLGIVADKSLDADHINHNGLDNRRENLRACPRNRNSANTRKARPQRSSQFKGVHFFKRTGRWTASIRIDGNTKHLGYFDTEVEAAKAYDRAALKGWGEYAHPNFLQEKGEAM